MPSKSTKPISGRVDNSTYFELMEMAKNNKMTLSQYVGYALSNLTKPKQSLGRVMDIEEEHERIDRVVPAPKPQVRQSIPTHVFNPNPLNDYGRVGVDIPPDITGYYTEEQVYRLELLEQKSVRGKWQNNLAIPKNQIRRGVGHNGHTSDFFPSNNVELLESFVTGNSFYPILYRVVSNSYGFIAINNEEYITFKGWEGIRWGRIIEKDYEASPRWFYTYEDFNRNEKNIMIKLI